MKMKDRIKKYLKENKNPEFNQEEIYKLIRTWEYDVGESFFDYNESIINVNCLVFWLYGKNYLDRTQLMAYVITSTCDYNDVFFNEETGILKNRYNVPGYDCDYDDDYEFAMYFIIADLLKDLPTYISRIKETFKAHEVGLEINLEYEKEMEQEIKTAKEIIDREILKVLKGE